MSTIVLKSLFAENFASFADRIIFTTEIDSAKKEYMQNTFTYCDSAFNKVSFLYGANGSGKSSFCKILLEIQQIISISSISILNDSKLLGLPNFKGIDKPTEKFAFDEKYKDKPTKFGIEIIIDNITYKYEFSIKMGKIEYEFLSKKHRRTEILLNRTSPSFKDILLKSELKSFDQNKHVVKEGALCLPMADFLNNKLANKVINAIQCISILNMTSPRLNPKNPKSSLSDERLRKYARILQKADPTLRKLKISLKEEALENYNLKLDDFDNREVIATQMTVSVRGEHAVYRNGEEVDNVSVDFFKNESLGTVKTFTALPYLYDVLDSGGILILDEIENGLHLSLVQEIIKLFTNNATNPHNAQLICTSHQPLLVYGDTRRDQVWIVNKDKYGKSQLHRMSQFSTSRPKINLAKRLLEGAFGCKVEQFFEDNPVTPT